MMLEPIRHILDLQQIVLASKSPRRQEILRNVGLKFYVCPSQYEEDLDPNQYEKPSDFVVATALNKVKEVAKRLMSTPNPPDLIIGADTVVSLDGKIFGKPKNEAAAFQMLDQLNSRSHMVYTGVVLIAGSTVVKFHESTRVFFGTLSHKTITKYIDTGEPMDKAGGYGIQGIGGSLIEKIDGDYYNVMGLPLHALCQHILDLNKDAVLP